MPTNPDRLIVCHGYVVDADNVEACAISLLPEYPDSNEAALCYHIVELVKFSRFSESAGTELDRIGVRIISDATGLN